MKEDLLTRWKARRSPHPIPIMTEQRETSARVAGGRAGVEFSSGLPQEKDANKPLDVSLIQSSKVPFFPLRWANWAFQSVWEHRQLRQPCCYVRVPRSRQLSWKPTTETHPFVKLKGLATHHCKVNAVKRAMNWGLRGLGSGLPLTSYVIVLGGQVPVSSEGPEDEGWDQVSSRALLGAAFGSESLCYLTFISSTLLHCLLNAVLL